MSYDDLKADTAALEKSTAELAAAAASVRGLANVVEVLVRGGIAVTSAVLIAHGFPAPLAAVGVTLAGEAIGDARGKVAGA